MKILKHRYSGKRSSRFWHYVNIGKKSDELYSLGVALQNLEAFVLMRMSQENPKYVKKEKL